MSSEFQKNNRKKNPNSSIGALSQIEVEKPLMLSVPVCILPRVASLPKFLVGETVEKELTSAFLGVVCSNIQQSEHSHVKSPRATQQLLLG